MRARVIRIVSACALLALAAAAGYALSTSLGREFLRHELEARLSGWLEGEVRIGALEVTFANGLGLRGEQVSAYPTDGRPGLHAREVRAELRESALLLGRLSLTTLTLGELEVRIERDAEGRFSFPPLQWLQDAAERDAADPESALAPVVAVEVVAQTLLHDLRVADQLTIERGSVHFEDRLARSAAQQPLRFQLEQIDGSLTRSWLSQRAQLRLDARLIDPAGRNTGLRLEGSAARAGDRRLSLEIDGLDLDALDPYLARLGAGTDLDGLLSGSLRFDAPDREHPNLDLELALQALATTLPIRGKPVQISLPLAEAQARLELRPGSVRLVRCEARGPEARLGFTAAVERPLRESSLARIDSEIHGVGLADVQPVLRQLPEHDLAALRLWFESLQSGRVDRLALTGRAALSRWGELARGELQDLPEGFLLEIDASDVTALLDDGQQLTDLRFGAAWSQQRLEIRQIRGRWQGQEIPTVDLTVGHANRFLATTAAPLEAPAAPIPGVSLLWNLLDESVSTDDPPQGFQTKLDLELDFVRHPLLRWPLEGLRLSIEALERGTEVNLTAGTWGGVPIVGEAVYLDARRVSVGIDALVSPEVDAEPALAEPPRPADDERWAAGRIAFGVDPGSRSETEPAVQSLSGELEMRGSRIAFPQLELALAPDAVAAVELEVDLANADQLDVSLAARFEHAQIGVLAKRLGLPAEFVTGMADVDARIHGPIHRGQPPLSWLEGDVSLVAEDGQIAQKIPVVVAVASATDGFNPFASRDVLEYESVRAELRVDRGKLVAERLEIEGPIRVYATGSVEFDRPPREVDAVVGVFLFQRARELLGMVPLVKLVIPGSDKGMVGAYFSVSGPLDDPEVSTLAMKSLQEELPDLFTRPFELLGRLLTREPDAPEAPPARGSAGADGARPL